MEIQEKINALMEQEEFRAAFTDASNAQEIVKLFASNGVEVPLTVAQELFLPATFSEEELSESALEDVAGGGKLGSIIGNAIGNGIFYAAG